MDRYSLLVSTSIGAHSSTVPALSAFASLLRGASTLSSSTESLMLGSDAASPSASSSPRRRSSTTWTAVPMVAGRKQRRQRRSRSCTQLDPAAPSASGKSVLCALLCRLRIAVAMIERAAASASSLCIPRRASRALARAE